MNRSRDRLIAMLVIGLMLTIILPIVGFADGLESQNIIVREVRLYGIGGSHSSSLFGGHFDGVGDVNGDEIDDFIVGEPLYGAGKAYLFHGRLDNSWTNLTLSNAQASFIGESYDDWFGRWTTGLGDINGDGYNDFAVSAMMNDEAGNMAGKVYVFLGSEDGWPMDTPATQANVSITGEAADDRLGHGVYGIGDTNGDSYDDFIVSGMMNDEGGTDAGQLYLFLGRPQNSWLNEYSASDANASWIGTVGSGLSLDASGLGDVNNDGFTDFAIGAFPKVNDHAYRKVYLIFGSDKTVWSMDQPISQSNASLLGPSDTGVETLAVSANWIAGAGDVNNDEFDDIIIGAFEENQMGTESGQTYIFFGRPTESWSHDILFSSANASFLGNSTGVWGGWEVDGVGDFNDDAYADIVISAPTRIQFPSRSDGAGHVYLILGGPDGKWQMNTSLTFANYTFETEQVYDGFGFHVQGIGDVNNDDLDDFAIGAPEFHSGAYYAGKTYLVLYQETSPTTTPTTPTTTTPPIDGIILGAAIVVMVVGLIALVVFAKRRG